MVDKAGIAGMNLSMGMSKGKCVVQKKSELSLIIRILWMDLDGTR